MLGGPHIINERIGDLLGFASEYPENRRRTGGEPEENHATLLFGWPTASHGRANSSCPCPASAVAAGGTAATAAAAALAGLLDALEDLPT